MKKRLEAELISIAHRILKLKNKSEVDQLYKETQKLYETLTVLKFYQDNFESVKSDMSEEVLEEKLEQSNQTVVEQDPVAEIKTEVAEPEKETETPQEAAAEIESAPEAEEQIVVSEEPEQTVESELEEEPTEEDADESENEEEVVVEDKPSFEPIFELETQEEEEKHIEPETTPIEKLEDHIGKYADPIFVKPDEVTLFPQEVPAETREEITAAIPVDVPKTAAVNEAMSKSIAIGLNDRIGFVQHLFNDSNEDFNRVISQLNTFDTFEEAKNFINEMVIPDYGYWVGEEDYMERFMEIVEKKFQ